MGGKSGGGGGRTTVQQPSAADQALAKQIEDLEAKLGKPLREAISPTVITTLQKPGVFDTTMAAPEREAIESQFNQAERSILNTGMRGGQLGSQLAGLARDRAATVAGATNAARERGTSRALGFLPVAFPGAEGSMTALAGIAGRDQARLLQNAQMRAQSDSAKGGAFGNILGISKMIFGPNL